MIKPEEWRWIVNRNDTTCRNPENDVTVKMKKIGENLKGTLHNMPVKLFAEISGYGNGEKIIEKIVKMAEAEYLSSEA